jgi:hypothetical protein
MKRLFCNGQPLQCKNSIGEGQEAVVYRLSPLLVAKIYRQPDDPYYQGNPTEQQAAKIRLQLISQKLKVFPKGLPSHAISPKDMITDIKGDIVGFTMAYIDQASTLLAINDKRQRAALGMDNNTIIDVFKDLHNTVSGIHTRGAVIGDFNDMNIMVKEKDAYVIDTDSWQYDKFLCTMYTDKYVDPLICKVQQIGNAEVFALANPHTAMTDWYAYTTVLWKSLLYVDPYGGIYKPKDPKNIVKQNLRGSKRITVLNPDVIYPKHAYPFKTLPKNMQDWMMDVYTKDKRSMFPAQLLQNVHWNTCTQCGIEYATPQCPVCHATSYITMPQQIIGQGVKVEELLRTQHTILYATVQNDTLMYVYTDGKDIYRENGIKIAPHDSKHHNIIRITGQKTYVVGNGSALGYESYKPTRQWAIDMIGNRPSFDAGMYGPCWVSGGDIKREKASIVGNETFTSGHVIEDQTIVWYQNDTGIGVARAGSIYELYIIPSGSRLIVRKTLLNLSGSIVDIQCYNSSSRYWILIQSKQKSKLVNICVCVDYNGKELGRYECDNDDGSWLGTIYGKTAFGNNLFSPTDEGIVSATVENHSFMNKLYQQTAPYVHSHCQLIASKKGIYVVTDHTIKLLSLT